MRLVAVLGVLLCACGGDPGGDTRDASPSDGSAVDTGPPVDRVVFLLPVGPSLFASATAADDACIEAATQASLSGTYHALIQFRDPAPSAHDRDPLTGVDRVVLPSGTVVSTGGEFWGPHTVPIDELADATQVPSACVWTGFDASGARLSTDSGDCTEWTSTSVGDVGYAGITDSASSTMMAWAYGAVQTCDVSCHVYCLQQ